MVVFLQWCNSVQCLAPVIIIEDLVITHFLCLWCLCKRKSNIICEDVSVFCSDKNFEASWEKARVRFCVPMPDITIIWNFTGAERLMERKGGVFYYYSEYMSVIILELLSHIAGLEKVCISPLCS